ncbi:DNA replication/repair protein RecF [Caldisericum exile]|uniref:DNA replication and repair protein RecF n=1 Tax=Caldisericum exile (strain DSM 21853 / NBRC 104410 / AZM16c01) TaxID=511051 RepID=A0A7U6GCY2_CALEA|nr:DNA replication and repair protein RecF [Caldisericum exile]BAL80130.1 putative DNA replication and repair protein RecF [Caldisericum exile AZM16c01]
MIIESLLLQNFRRFKEERFNFDSGFNIIIGKNGSGKTTLLEAIYLLSTGKSFVTNAVQNCVNVNDDYFFIEGIFNKVSGADANPNTLSILFSRDKKIVHLNKRKVKALSEIIGKFPVIVTDYALVELVKDGPSKRRDFINHVLTFTDEDYYKNVLRYYSFLERRNEYLKNGNFTMDLLIFLSQEIYDYGRKIREKREKIINDFNERIRNIFYTIFEKESNLTIIYRPSKLEKLLDTDSLTDEVNKKRTLYGIHLDEIEIFDGEINLREFASLGEAYSIGFILKLIESELIERYKGTAPILLLDDFFSHLDEVKRDKILNYIKNNQVILTSVSIDDVSKKILDSANIITLENGSNGNN